MKKTIISLIGLLCLLSIFAEGFETWPPTDWTLTPGTGTGAWLQDNGSDHGPSDMYEGSYAAMFNNYDYSNLSTGSMISPVMDLSTYTTPIVKFYWWNNDSSTNNIAYLKLYSKIADGEWILVDEIEAHSSGLTTWVEATNVVSTSITQFKVEAISDYGSKNTFVDAFEVIEAPLVPEVILSTESIDFAMQAITTSTTETVTLTNAGGGTLNITSIAISGANSSDFTFAASNDLVLTANEVLSVEVTFNPATVGDKVANLVITDDLARTINTISLVGSGFDPVVREFPYTEGFENDWVNSPTAPLGWSQITVSGIKPWVKSTSQHHTGSASAFGSWAGSGGEHLLVTPAFDFDATTSYRLKFWLDGSTSSGTDLKVQIASNFVDATSFTTELASYVAGTNMPSSWTEQTITLVGYSGQQTIAFRLIDDDGYSLYLDDVTVEEIPSTPIVDLSTESIDFDAQVITTSTTETVTLSNIGGGILNITDIAISGTNASEFSFVASDDVALAATEELSVDITFNPTTVGDKVANLVITDDLTRTINTVSLVGSCFDPTLTLPLTVDFNGGTTMPVEITEDNMSVSATHGNDSFGLYKNIYGSSPDAYAQFQIMEGITANSQLAFEYRIVEFSSYPSAASELVADEYIKILVSADGGVNFTDELVIDESNHAVSMDFSQKFVSLGAYAGQTIIVRLEAHREADDYYVDFDNFMFREAPSNPEAQIDTTPLAFGGVIYNEVSDSKIVTLTNIGAGQIDISSVTITGTDADQFTVSDNGDYALESTESLIATVTATPTTVGEKSATLVITDNMRTVYSIELSSIAVDTDIYEINIPYSQGFETDIEFLGWEADYSSTNTYVKAERIESNAHTGSYSFKNYNSGDSGLEIALTSPIIVPDLNAYRLIFWVKGEGNVSVGKVNSSDEFTELESFYATSTYTEHRISMAATRSNERLVFKTTFNSTYKSVYLDDVVLEALPTGALVSITPESTEFTATAIDYESDTETFTLSNTGVLAASITEIAVHGGGFIVSHEIESFPYQLEPDTSIDVEVSFAPEAAMIYSSILRIKEATSNPFVPNVYESTLTGTGFVPIQGSLCTDPIAVTFPVVELVDDTENYGNYYTSSGVDPTSTYLAGNEVVYQFTLANRMLLNGTIVGDYDYFGAYIMQSEPNVETPADVLLSKSASSGTITFTNQMIDAGTYFMILGCSSYHESFGYTMNLTAEALPIPVAVTSPNPATEAIDIPTETTLTWSNPAYTESIDLYFGEVGSRTMALVLDNVTPVEEYQPAGLDINTVYNWKVVARNYSGATADADVVTWSFTTISSAPDPIAYTTPANASTNASLIPTLNWTASPTANGYKVYTSTSADFAGITPVEVTTNSYDLSNLTYSTEYFWKVVPFNVIGDAEGAETWSFTTMEDPTLILPITVNFDGSSSNPAEITSENMGLLVSHGVESYGLYKNIYASSPEAYAQFQSMRGITAGAEMVFEYRIMDYVSSSSYPAGSHTIVEGDYIKVNISNDNGTSFTTLHEINSATHVVSTDFANVSVSLAAYAGQDVIVRLEAHREAGDYFVDFDNFYFGEAPTDPIADLSVEELSFSEMFTDESSSAQTVTISNIGVSILNVTNIEITGVDAAQFSYSTEAEASMALAEDETLDINVTYSPLFVGDHEATLVITDDLSRNSYNITLNGSALLNDNNDTPETATTLILDTVDAVYSIAVDADIDWYRFEAVAGAELSMYSTQIVGSTFTDNEAWLYYSPLGDGSDITPNSGHVSTDDDGGDSPSANHFVIDYTTTNAGWYFLRVAHYSDNPTVSSKSKATTRGTTTGEYMLTVTAVNPIVELEAPANLTIVSNVDGRLLSWDAVDGAVTYKVYGCATPDGTYDLMTQVTETSFLYTEELSMEFFYVTASIDAVPAKNIRRRNRN